MSRERIHRAEFSPAAIGSLALHAAVALALTITWGARDLKVGSVVPVNIVASGPSEPPPAIQAPEAQTAQAEEVSEAPPEPAPPPPAPAPPTKAARPAEKTPAPTPARPAAKAAEKSLNLDNLYASLTVPKTNRPTAPTKGAARPQTDPVPRATNGFSGASGTEVSSEMQGELERYWFIDCSLASTRDVIVRTYFTVGAGGRLVGDVEMEAKGSTSPAVIDAAKFRARQAVLRAQPFLKEPRQNWGRRLYADFNARKICSRPAGA